MNCVFAALVFNAFAVNAINLQHHIKTNFTSSALVEQAPDYCDGFADYLAQCHEPSWSGLNCMLRVETLGNSCQNYCLHQGSYCIKAQDNYLESCERDSGASVSCFATWGDQICVCAPKFLPSNYFTMTGDCDAVGDCVSSNNYPTSHGHNEQCSVTMSQDASVTVGSTFSLETCCDHLMIRGNDVESPDAVPLNFNNGESFSWSSDSSVGRPGWRLCFSPYVAPTPVPDYCDGFADYITQCHEPSWSGLNCMVRVETLGNSCQNYCLHQGSYCIKAQDNYHESCERDSGASVSCFATWVDQICVCAPKKPKE